MKKYSNVKATARITTIPTIATDRASRADFVELEGSKKAISFLCNYYKIREMKIIVNGRKVGNAYLACYDQNVACFRPRALNRKIVLHEFYHHIIYCKKIKMKDSVEEREANHFVIQFLHRI